MNLPGEQKTATNHSPQITENFKSGNQNEQQTLVQYNQVFKSHVVVELRVK